MAANLIYLKSRSLLPVDQQPPEEDAEEDDPRWDLIRQLIEYKKFKEAAAQLQVRQLEQERIFVREPIGMESAMAAPLRLGEVGIFQLINAFQAVLKRVDARENLRGDFRRALHRLGQDRVDFAARGGRRAVAVLGIVREHGVAGRDRGHVSRAPRIDPVATGQGHAIGSLCRNRTRAPLPA